MLTATRNIYLAPDGKPAVDSGDGKNELLAYVGTVIDEHTAETLKLEAFMREADAAALEADTKGSTLLEQAKARQDADKDADKDAAKPEAKATPKSDAKNETAKAEGGSK